MSEWKKGGKMIDLEDGIYGKGIWRDHKIIPITPVRQLNGPRRWQWEKRNIWNFFLVVESCAQFSTNPHLQLMSTMGVQGKERRKYLWRSLCVCGQRTPNRTYRGGLLGSIKEMGIIVLMDGDSIHVRESLGTITGTRTMDRNGHTYHRISIWLGVVG